MESTVQRWSSAEGFLGVAREFLVAHEAEHCLMIGLAMALVDHPEIYPGARLWTVHAAGRMVAAALRTPPHNLVLSRIEDPRHLAALAEDVLASDEPPGAIGPVDAVRAVADAWTARTGRAAERTMQERIFRLDRVIAPPSAPGRWREAEEADRARLEAWLTAFHVEAQPAGMPAGDVAAVADRFLRRLGRVIYLWERDGEVVSLAGAAGATPRGIRIGPVYTPPDRRGHGYAGNLVAAVSAHQLATGRDFCFLFTDLANPISNRIYQAIGYVAVIDVDMYLFPAAPAA